MQNDVRGCFHRAMQVEDAVILGAGIFAVLGSGDILARYRCCHGSAPRSADHGLGCGYGCGFSCGPAPSTAHYGRGPNWRTSCRVGRSCGGCSAIARHGGGSSRRADRSSDCVCCSAPKIEHHGCRDGAGAGIFVKIWISDGHDFHWYLETVVAGLHYRYLENTMLSRVDGVAPRRMMMIDP